MFKFCCEDCGECWYVGNPRTCKCPNEELAHASKAFDVAYENHKRNEVLEEVAQEIEKFKGFGEDTISSFAIYIRNMKK